MGNKPPKYQLQCPTKRYDACNWTPGKGHPKNSDLDETAITNSKNNSSFRDHGPVFPNSGISCITLSAQNQNIYVGDYFGNLQQLVTSDF